MSNLHSQDSTSEISVDKAVPIIHHHNMGTTKHEEEQPQPGVLAAPQEEPLVWSQTRSWMQDGFSEFFGTMIMILFGDGVVAQVVLSKGTKGDYQSISWGWG